MAAADDGSAKDGRQLPAPVCPASLRALRAGPVESTGSTRRASWWLGISTVSDPYPDAPSIARAVSTWANPPAHGQTLLPINGRFAHAFVDVSTDIVTRRRIARIMMWSRRLVVTLMRHPDAPALVPQPATVTATAGVENLSLIHI
jgi:hypothetical protein